MSAPMAPPLDDRALAWLAYALITGQVPVEHGVPVLLGLSPETASPGLYPEWSRPDAAPDYLTAGLAKRGPMALS